VGAEGAHLVFGVPGVGGEAQLPGGRAHDLCPVADRYGFESRAVQDRQVSGQASDVLPAQGGERLGHGRAHQPEVGAVVGQACRVAAAPVQGRGHAGHERGMVGQPAVHVGDPPDREALLAERRFQLCQQGIAARFQRRRLLPDAHILGYPVPDEAADAGEPEPDLAGDTGGYRRPPGGVVPEEDDHRGAAQRGEPRARGFQLLVPDRHQHKVVAAGRRVIGHRDRGLRAAAVLHVAGRQPASGDVIGPRRVAQDRHPVARSAQVRPVHRPDHASPDDERVHGSSHRVNNIYLN
jgi:hypothetical protein